MPSQEQKGAGSFKKMRYNSHEGLTGARPLDEEELNLLSATLLASPDIPLGTITKTMASLFKQHLSYLVYTQMMSLHPKESPPRST